MAFGVTIGWVIAAAALSTWAAGSVVIGMYVLDRRHGDHIHGAARAGR